MANLFKGLGAEILNTEVLGELLKTSVFVFFVAILIILIFFWILVWLLWYPVKAFGDWVDRRIEK